MNAGAGRERFAPGGRLHPNSCRHLLRELTFLLGVLLGPACAGQTPIFSAPEAVWPPVVAAPDSAPIIIEPAPRLLPLIDEEFLPYAEPEVVYLEPANPSFWADLHTVDDRLWADACNFYDRRTLLALGAGVAGHAILANTDIDESLRREYQERQRGAGTDEISEFFHSHKTFGEGTFALPIYGVALGSRYLFPDSGVANVTSEWGERSLRTFAVGVPPVLLLQYAIGASRPGETDHTSQWRPFEDSNGVSGHSFMGAIPFITAAKMTDRPLLKGAFYTASLLPGFSRFNDDDHYLSQVALGWWIAYLSASAVDDSFGLPPNMELVAGPVADGDGVSLIWRW